MAQQRSATGVSVGAHIAEASARYRWVILFITFLGFAVAYMQRLSLGPLAPFIITGLGITKAKIGLISSSATLGYGLTLIPAGWVTDKIGVRWTLCIGQVIAGLFLIGMLFADTFVMGMVVMFGAGLGLGFISPSCVRAVVMWFPLKERAMAMGINNMSVNAGGMITAATLPMIAIAYGWRYGFMVLGSMAIVSGLVPAIFYKDPSSGGAQALAGGAAAPVVKKESWINVFKGREVWLIIIGGSSLYIVEFGVLTFFVLYLKAHLLVPVVAAGFLLGSIDFGGLFGKPIAGLISDRIFNGRRKPAFMTLSAISTILACVFAFLTPGTPQWLIVIFCSIFGFAAVGWGGIYFTMVGECAGKDNVGVVSGACSLGLVLANVLGVPVFGYLADRTGTWIWSWGYLVVLGVIGFIALAFIREEMRRIST